MQKEYKVTKSAFEQAVCVCVCIFGISTVVRRIKKQLSELWREKVDFAKSNRARQNLKWRL